MSNVTTISLTKSLALLHLVSVIWRENKGGTCLVMFLVVSCHLKESSVKDKTIEEDRISPQDVVGAL